MPNVPEFYSSPNYKGFFDNIFFQISTKKLPNLGFAPTF